MCNLYSLTKGQQAIADFAGAMREPTGDAGVQLFVEKRLASEGLNDESSIPVDNLSAANDE